MVPEEKEEEGILIGHGDVIVVEKDEHIVVKLRNIKRKLDVIAVIKFLIIA